MRYVGGKSKLAGKIKRDILRHSQDRTHYLEPFVGGGATFAAIAPHFKTAACGDASLDLILMWQAVATGWLPPEHVTSEEYQAFRHAEPSALRGFLGFGCSFGGKWFGGWARGYTAKGEPRNYAAESVRNIANLAPAFYDAEIRHTDFADWKVDANTVVYCDPPYEGTESYGATDNFDHNRFWNTLYNWADQGALVFSSEYAAPKGVTCVAEYPHRRTLTLVSQDRPATIERLWMVPCDIRTKRNEAA